MSETRTKEIKITIPEELFTLFLPEKTLHHFHNARKEMLLALRSLIDARIEAFDKKEEKRTARGKKIKVE
ncbi:MAG: hypothetical protein ACE5LC_04850 [Candidatus Aminicenantales bacterium]